MTANSDFMQKAARSPWVLIPGFHVSRVWGDYLHIVDLALAPEAATSVAWLAWSIHFFAPLRDFKSLYMGIPDIINLSTQALLELTSKVGVFSGGGLLCTLPIVPIEGTAP